jgi:hypothetical protein
MALNNAQFPGKFYMVGAFLIPTEADKIKGIKKQQIVPPTFIVADDDQSAHNATVLMLPEGVDPDRCEVFIALPFGR